MYEDDGDCIMENAYPEIIEIDDDVVEIIPTKKHEIIVIEDDKPYKKKHIPLVVKRKVWDKWVGRSIGITLCQCCKLSEISQMSFHCGHVISEKNGGEICVDNLRPICQSCNSSIGIHNMMTFINKYKL